VPANECPYGFGRENIASLGRLTPCADLAAARSALGGERIAAAWAVGRALWIDEALELPVPFNAGDGCPDRLAGDRLVRRHRCLNPGCQSAGQDSSFLVSADLLFDLVAVRADIGPGVRQILSTQRRIGSQQICLAGP
jgi:hypothetical protein